MKISLTEIYIEFLKLGIQLLGGGYVIVPLMQKYFIDGKKWLTTEELTEYYALSQSIPGIIAANISTFVGYKLRGKSGAAVALLGIITTPIISILIIATVLDQLLKFSFIQSIFWGVSIAVIILIYLSIKEMWKYSITDLFSWILFIGTFVMSYFLDISPAITILVGVSIGIFWKIIQEKRKSK